MLEIIIAILGVVIPILWAHLVKKLNELSGANEILQNLVLYGSKEVQDLYLVVFEEIKKRAKDNQITPEERDEIIQIAVQEAQKRGIKLFEIMSPKIYKSILEVMLDRALQK